MPKGKVTKKKDCKSIQDKEGIEEEGQGLKLVWSKFLSEYVKLGCKDAGQAYKIAYNEPDMKAGVASANACRLLKHVNIREELNNILGAQKVTENFIYEGLRSIATKYRGAKTINAAVRSYELLGKMRGMLTDTTKIAFDENNPALFPALVKAENKEKWDKETSRISE